MCTYEKIIAFLALCVFAVSAIATPVIPEEDQFNILTVPQVCELIADDGESLANMYVRGATKEHIAGVISKRNDDLPQMAFNIPGILKMLTVLEDTKTTNPGFFLNPNFAKLMKEESYKACVRDNMDGWIMTVPGKAEPITLPPESEKVQM